MAACHGQPATAWQMDRYPRLCRCWGEGTGGEHYTHSLPRIPVSRPAGAFPGSCTHGMPLSPQRHLQPPPLHHNKSNSSPAQISNDFPAVEDGEPHRPYPPFARESPATQGDASPKNQRDAPSTARAGRHGAGGQPRARSHRPRMETRAAAVTRDGKDAPRRWEGRAEGHGGSGGRMRPAAWVSFLTT